jgi:hypothetical protein
VVHFREKRTAVVLKPRQTQEADASSVSGETEYAPALSSRFRRAPAAAMLLLVALAGDVRAEPGVSDPASSTAPAKAMPKPKAVQAVQAAPQPAQQPVLPGVDGLLYLIRSTLLTLNDANRSGNYTVLRDLAAPDFQAKNTAADLAAIFTDLRRRNFDLFAVAVTAPQLTASPALDANRLLRSADCFRPGRCRSTSISSSRWSMADGVSTASLSRPRKRRRRPRRPNSRQTRPHP